MTTTNPNAFKTIDENPGMSREDAFSYVLDHSYGYKTPPRNDRSFGNRATRRATYPARADGRIANR
jgi:hypothetical protein